MALLVRGGRALNSVQTALERTDILSVFLSPLTHVLNALVYAETGADVTTVLVDGRIVLEHGRVLNVDEERIYARAQAAAERLLAQSVYETPRPEGRSWNVGAEARPLGRQQAIYSHLGADNAPHLCPSQDAQPAFHTPSRTAAAWTLGDQLMPYMRAACRAAVATPYPVNRYAAPVAEGREPCSTS